MFLSDKINLVFRAKWRFIFPKKNKIILFDGRYNPFNKYIDNKNMTILHIRGEEINLPILFLCFIKKKFTFFEYSLEFIKHVSPKLIITAFDYHPSFYLLSKTLSIKTLMIQRGKRSLRDNIVKNSKSFFPKDSKKKFTVDFILVHNQSVKEFYEKRINGRVLVIGSFENNFHKISKKHQKKEVLFISNFILNEKNKIDDKSEYDNLIAKQLSELSKKNNLRFNIMPRNRGNKQLIKKEFEYYNKKIKDKFNFLSIKKSSGLKSLGKYKYIFTNYSSMGIEALSQGMRCGFIFCKSKSNRNYGLRIGGLEKFNYNGPFWQTSNVINVKQIEKVFNFVTRSSNNKWNTITKKYSKKLMAYNFQNKIFRSIINKYCT